MSTERRTHTSQTRGAILPPVLHRAPGCECAGAPPAHRARADTALSCQIGRHQLSASRHVALGDGEPLDNAPGDGAPPPRSVPPTVASAPQPSAQPRTKAVQAWRCARSLTAGCSPRASRRASPADVPPVAQHWSVSGRPARPVRRCRPEAGRPSQASSSCAVTASTYLLIDFALQQWVRRRCACTCGPRLLPSAALLPLRAASHTHPSSTS
jgi:hypothetical protein